MKRNLKLYEEFINEINKSFVSGTKAGTISYLSNKKYILKKSVENVTISLKNGKFQTTLPKDTIINNIPGGVFAIHPKLKDSYGRNPEWNNKFGIGIISDQKILKQIEDNSKILESLNESFWPKSKLPTTFADTLSKELDKLSFSKRFHVENWDLYYNNIKLFKIDGDDSVEKVIKKVLDNASKNFKISADPIDKIKIKDAFKSFNESKEKMEDDPCWDDYEMVGTKKKDGKEVPNCVPKNENYEGNESDLEYELGIHLKKHFKRDNILKSIKKTPKGFEIKMSGQIDRNKLSQIASDIGAKLVDFTAGAEKIAIFESENAALKALDYEDVKESLDEAYFYKFDDKKEEFIVFRKDKKTNKNVTITGFKDETEAKKHTDKLNRLSKGYASVSKALKKNSLNEKASYERGCAMLYFESDCTKKIHEMIKEEDLYIEEGDVSYGIEDKPHCTLLYGFDPKVKANEAFEICEKFSFETCKAENVSLFESDKYDVLKYDIQGKNLKECNEALSKLPFKTDYPDYHPHMTIAYLKKGKGKDYVKMVKEKYESLEVNPQKIVFSHPDGSKEEIKAILEKTKL